MNPSNQQDVFQTTRRLQVGDRQFVFHSLNALAARQYPNIRHLPWSYRVLLEGLLRHNGEPGFSDSHVHRLASWQPGSQAFAVPFLPARVLLQDFTGIPVLNDLTSFRSALKRRGMDASWVDLCLPCDLVVDHSLQVDAYGCPEAQQINEELEYSRNSERYQFLRWCQAAYPTLRVFPPGSGIIHQVNLEYLAKVVAFEHGQNGEMWAYPDTVFGTDSHTTMVNGLGVLGWGVGGIEAVSALMGIASENMLPDVIGLKLTGSLPLDVTPTDLTLHINALLRRAGVVGKIIEVFGPAVAGIGAEERAAIANMTPESGATATFFAVDEHTLRYLRLTGRDAHQIVLVEAYCREQGLFYETGTDIPRYNQVIELNLNGISRVIAGPKRPHELIALTQAAQAIHALAVPPPQPSPALDQVVQPGTIQTLPTAVLVLAAITSCTNTSSPINMLTAGLLAKRAVEKGLSVPRWVKTVLAPGSRAVREYLQQAGLLPFLEKLGFNVVGYGCTVCIGNSGPLQDWVDQALKTQAVLPCAVLSGNRNFEGRIHPAVQANFLASPALVLAYALAGRMDIDFATQALGVDVQGQEVFLGDIWPERGEVQAAADAIQSQLYTKTYQNMLAGNAKWNSLPTPVGDIYPWTTSSVYLQEPPFLLGQAVADLGYIQNARVLAVLQDGITTDHISPAGSIQSGTCAFEYLRKQGALPTDINAFGAYRANHEVMLRGVFSNARLNNLLTGGKSGGFTRHFPSEQILTIFDAAEKYCQESVPLIVLAGENFGVGSSRDWAAKGLALLGVRAVLAQSFERIHRANLVMMGVLPLQFLPGENVAVLDLTGREKFSISGLESVHAGGTKVTARAEREDGSTHSFELLCRVDTALELEYWNSGGILPYILNTISVKQ